MLQRVRGSLARMGVHHIDLLQLHWEDFKAHGWIDVMKHLVALQKSGLVRHVGVTNFDVPRLLRLLDAGIKPVTNQVGGCWASGLVVWCRTASIAVERPWLGGCHMTCFM